MDSVVALNAALLVNAAILILSASTFFKRGIVVSEIEQAHQLLTPLLGTTMASVLFAVALLASGQSSTITGTMAGQIVMEGFLNFRMRPWLRRLLTRMLAIIPAAITVFLSGEEGTYRLLILSQVVLSLQLPFAVIPLSHFTSDPMKMGEFTNPGWVKLIAWSSAVLIVALNLWLVATTFNEWLEAAGEWKWVLALLLAILTAAILGLLVFVTFNPWLPENWRRGRPAAATPEVVAEVPAAITYKTILVPLDHSDRDREAVAHGAALALSHQAKMYLVHVEEGVTSQVYGPLSSTVEVQTGMQYFEEIVDRLKKQSIDVELIVRHSSTPSDEIVKVARQVKPDLVVMGAHGHKWLKDLVLGTTIEAVRHDIAVPVLIVRDTRE